MAVGIPPQCFTPVYATVKDTMEKEGEKNQKDKEKGNNKLKNKEEFEGGLKKRKNLKKPVVIKVPKNREEFQQGGGQFFWLARIYTPVSGTCGSGTRRLFSPPRSESWRRHTFLAPPIDTFSEFRISIASSSLLILKKQIKIS